MLQVVTTEVVSGLALLAAAIAFGRWLFIHARRYPNSPLTNSGMLADLICVGELFLLVIGLMLLFKALLTIT